MWRIPQVLIPSVLERIVLTFLIHFHGCDIHYLVDKHVLHAPVDPIIQLKVLGVQNFTLARRWCFGFL